jgi:hypothetical protein
MQALVQSCDACKLNPVHVTPPITLFSFFDKNGPQNKGYGIVHLEIFFLIPSLIQRQLHYNTASPYVVVIAAYSTCHVWDWDDTKYGVYHPSTESARFVLIKTCLASIPVYILSFLKFPKWAIQLLNYHMANCLWNDDSEGNSKYQLVN